LSEGRLAAGAETSRFNARMTRIRANIVGLSRVATSKRSRRRLPFRRRVFSLRKLGDVGSRICSSNCAHYLVCFCAPLACHGDLLLWLANASRDHRIAWWRGQIDHWAWRCG